MSEPKLKPKDSVAIVGDFSVCVAFEPNDLRVLELFTSVDELPTARLLFDGSYAPPTEEFAESFVTDDLPEQFVSNWKPRVTIKQLKLVDVRRLERQTS